MDTGHTGERVHHAWLCYSRIVDMCMSSCQRHLCQMATVGPQPESAVVLQVGLVVQSGFALLVELGAVQ